MCQFDKCCWLVAKSVGPPCEQNKQEQIKKQPDGRARTVIDWARGYCAPISLSSIATVHVCGRHCVRPNSHFRSSAHAPWPGRDASTAFRSLTLLDVGEFN